MKKEDEIPIGTRVIMSENSQFFNSEDSYEPYSANPINIEGTVIYINSGDLYIEVEWDNNRINSYTKKDLIIISEEYQIF